jgi:TATA-box binding protein (TBP) (component of TFIID and TFIIIB)
MTSLISELAPPVPGGLPGRMVNVAAHTNITMPDRHVNVGNLNVGFLATLGNIGMKYNKAQFGAGQVCIRIYLSMADGEVVPEVVTVLVFESGKLIFTGGENEYVTLNGAHQFAMLLGSVLERPIAIGFFSVNNIVFNYFLQFQVRLREFSEAEGVMCKYVPDDFPAIIYRFSDKFAALINYTGRVIITGSRSRELTAQAYGTLYRKLLPYCDGEPPRTGLLHDDMLPGRLVGMVPAAGDGAARSDRFLRMNHHFSVLMDPFMGGDDLDDKAEPLTADERRLMARATLDNVARLERADPEFGDFGIGRFLDEYDHAPRTARRIEEIDDAVPALAGHKRKRKGPK